MLNIESVSVNYGALRALRKSSLTARRGAITALIGLNGAGKTTLLNACMGALPLAGGRVIFDGGDVTRLSTLERVRRGLALCPEGRQVFPRMSVAENLRMGGYTLPRREVRPRMEELLEQFPRLAARMRQQAGTLSGGEQQWLAIARALMCRPRLLMMDEPTLGLDVIARSELWDVIRDMKGHATIILTTHYMEEAEALSDRVGVMKDGRLLALGTPGALKAQTGQEKFEDAFIAIVRGASK